MAKKATKAEVIQEWHEPDKSWSRVRPTGGSQETALPVYLAESTGLLYRARDSGRLEPWLNCPRLPAWSGAVRYFQSGGHVLAQSLNIRSNARTRANDEPLREESTLTLLWDGAEKLPCPLTIEVGGRLAHSECFPTADGGLLVYLHGVLYAPLGQLDQIVRYDAAGQELWRREVGFGGPLFCPGGLWLTMLTRAEDRDVGDLTFLDLEGAERAHVRTRDRYRLHLTLPEAADELWFLTEDQSAAWNLVRLSPEGTELARAQLASRPLRLYPAGELAVCLGDGVDLLERDTLQVRAALPQRCESFLGEDGQGRLWFWNRGMAECRDQSLQEISRHRLKGGVLGSHLDREGRLCAVTYSAREELVRVCRLW